MADPRIEIGLFRLGWDAATGADPARPRPQEDPRIDGDAEADGGQRLPIWQAAPGPSQTVSPWEADKAPPSEKTPLFGRFIAPNGT